MSTSGRSCSTPWTFAASPGATPPTAPAGRRRCFLPPTDDTGLWLINLEELPSCVPMVQAALYQLALERKVGEYELPEGASLIACGNREGDRGVVHRMPTPLASRFVHLEIRVDAEDWLAWGAANGIAPEVPVLRAARTDAPASIRPAVEGEGVPVPEDVAFHQQHRAPPQRPRPGGRARAVPGQPSARPRRSSSPPSSRSGVSCPIPGPSSTTPRTPTSRRTRAR